MTLRTPVLCNFRFSHETCVVCTLFSWSSSRTVVSQTSHETILYFPCPYKVPSGSELPTREMAYHRAQIDVIIFPETYSSALLRGFRRDKSIDAGITLCSLEGYS